MMIPLIAAAVVLQITNLAHAPITDVAQATRGVTRLYGDIGVEVAWAASEPRVPETTAIRIVLIPFETGELQRSRHAVMGAAMVTPQGTSVAYVFYRQVLAQATDHRASISLVLACAMAHEIGHLLLPDRSHSESGLMRACWRRNDFHLADRSQLRFSNEQAMLIRAGLDAQPRYSRR